MIANALAISLAALVAGAAAQNQPAPPAKTDPYQPSQAPLDKRIGKPEKITQADPPPLPERVVLPKPPEFRISAKPEDVPINPDLWKKANESIKNLVGMKWHLLPLQQLACYR